MLYTWKQIIFLVLLLYAGAIQHAFAQGVPIAKCYGGNGDDVFQDASPMLNGNFLFVGYTTSTDLPGLPPKSDIRRDAWLGVYSRKLEPTGVGYKSFGGSGDDEFKRVLVTDDGGFLILGITNSNDNLLENKHELNDVWLLKLDKNLNVQWQRAYGGDLEDKPGDIIRSTDLTEESYIILAETTSNNGDVSGNHGQADVWVFKITVSGELKWSKCIGGTKLESLPSVITSIGDNKYYITAASESGDNDFLSLSLKGKNDAVVCLVEDKITTLDFINAYSFGGSENEKVSYSFLSGDKAVLFTSTASSDMDAIGNHSVNTTDGWTLIFNTNDGSIQAPKFFGGSGFEEIVDVKKLPDGTYLTLYESTSSNGDLTTNKGDFDIWLVKLDKDYSIVSQTNYGGSNLEKAYKIVPLCDGGFFVLASTTSSDFDIPTRSGTNSDAWMMSFPGRTTTIDPENTEICKGELVSLTSVSNPPGDIFWYDKLVGGNLIRTAPDFPLDTFTQTKTLYFSPAPDCLVHDSVEIKVISFSDSITESGTRKFCEGTTALGLDAYEDDPECDYLWSIGVSTKQIVAEKTGDYFLIVSKGGKCSDTSEVIPVIKMAKPFARAGIMGPNLISESVSFKDNSSSDVISWYWNFGDGENSEEQNPTHVFQSSGKLFVSMKVTNADECTDVWDTLYPVSPGLEFCNIFTPNGDGVNDFFEVKNLESLSGAKLIVYSRWGEVVYESDDYKNNWDASDLPSGTYFYVFKLKKRYDKQGTVTVVK